jgi:hypothetical protein
MTTIIARSAESVHWYGQDGSPQYTVKAKNGSDRPTTLRDARKFNLVPSVTTVLKIAAKPGLEAWKLEQMLLAALTLPRLQDEDEKAFIARVAADSKETAKQAAERGTRIHEEVESHFAGNRSDRGWAVEGALFEHFKLNPDSNWLVERSFASGGFGGKVDMHLKPCAEAQHGIVADVKSKDFDVGDEVIAYDEHLLQLAAYRHGLGMPHARCANIFVSVKNPKLTKIVEWSEDDIKRGWEMFQCLLKYWILKNQFGEKS